MVMNATAKIDNKKKNVEEERAITRFEYKKMSIEAQFKGNAAPTQTTWKLLKDSEGMPFDQQMALLRTTKMDADRASILLNAVCMVQTGEQLGRLTLKIGKSKCPSETINVIETNYPNNRMANKLIQLVASNATQRFIAKLNARTDKKTIEGTEESEENQPKINMEIRSIR